MLAALIMDQWYVIPYFLAAKTTGYFVGSIAHRITIQQFGILAILTT
jgi:hypothetical protein